MSDAPESSATGIGAEGAAAPVADVPEPPWTVWAFVAVYFLQWFVFWVSNHADDTLPLWAQLAGQIPGLAIGILFAEGFARRSRVTWLVALAISLLAIVLGLLNQRAGTPFTNLFVGGQIIAGVVQLALLLLPPTRRWIAQASYE